MSYQSGLILSTQPNWKEGFIERLEFRTEIFRNVLYFEQRRGWRRLPRVTTEAEYLLQGHEMSALQEMLYYRPNAKFIMPFWPAITALTLPAALDTFTVSADTVDRGFKVGGLAVLTDGTLRRCEYLTVASFTDTTVTFTSPVDNAWGTGTILVPAGTGRLADNGSFTSKALTADVTSVRLQFAYDAGNPPILLEPAADPAPADEGFYGIDAFFDEPNWKEGISFDIETAKEQILDYQTGVFSAPEYESMGPYYHDYTLKTFPYSWFLNGRDKVIDFRKFLMRRRGRNIGFHMPTWMHDLRMTEAYNPVNDFITVQFTSNTWGMGYYLMIILRNGTRYLREIFAVQDNADGTADLTMSSPFPSAFTPSDVRKMTFMSYARLGSDMIEINWENPVFAQARMAVTYTQEY